MAITVNSLNIDDNVNYLVEEITVRSMPQRDVITQQISRRPGDKLLALEWKQKEITIKGRVFASTPAAFRTVLDTMQQNFAVRSLALSIDTDRSYTANLVSMDVPTQFFNNSMAQYTAKFLSIDPFSYGSILTASGTVVSGTLTLSGSLTVSGTVFAEPRLTITPIGANVGDSGIRAMKITYIPTGETMTISGNLNYNAPYVIDYSNFLVTMSGVSSDYNGIFSRWEPKNNPNLFTITVTSGVQNGYNYAFSYQPRYYN